MVLQLGQELARVAAAAAVCGAPARLSISTGMESTRRSRSTGVMVPAAGAVAGMTRRCKDGPRRARRTGDVLMMRFGERRRVATTVVAAAAALLLPVAVAAQDRKSVV